MTWARTDAIRAGLPVRLQSPADSRTGIPDVPLGMVAAAGGVVVAASAAPGGTATSEVVTLRFINATTGALLASRPLSVSSFAGLRADTVEGKPVVEAVYQSPQRQDNSGLASTSFMDTVFDTSGRQVWTNGGAPLSNYIGSGLLVGNTGGLVSGGYTLRFNQGVDTLGHKASYTVQDLSGKAILTVPRWASVDPKNPNLGIINGMQLVGGYAVVIHGGPGKSSTDPPYDRFTVYDLGRGAKQVADPMVTFPSGPHPSYQAQAVAGCGGKLVLGLTDASYTGQSSVRLTVLDLATGRTTAPVDVALAWNSRAVGELNELSGMTDANCSTMLITGRIPASIAIDLSTGTLRWHQPTSGVTYHYLSIYDGVIYALQEPTATPPPTMAGRLVAIAAASGSPQDADFTAVPLASTADGTAIVAQIPNDPPPASPTRNTGQYTSRPQLSSTLAIQIWASRSTS